MINQKFVDTEELSAWPTGGGMIRIQTRIPHIAEAVSRLKDTWKIGESVCGGYLRLFHTTQPQRKIRRTLERILSRISSQGVPSQEARRTPEIVKVDRRQPKLDPTRCRALQRKKVSSRIRPTKTRVADGIAPRE